MKYKRWHSPQFREAFLRLDEEAQKRIADWVLRMQKGDVEGVSNGLALEIETEAGELISYDLKRNTLFLLDLHVIS